MSKYNKVDYSTEKFNPLIDGEEELWSGKPKKSAFMFNQIMTMAPIAIIWLAFDSTFLGLMLSDGDFLGEAGFGMLIFLIGFFALHLMPVWIWLGNIITANQNGKTQNIMLQIKEL